jgi:hypothetical protein
VEDNSRADKHQSDDEWSEVRACVANVPKMLGEMAGRAVHAKMDNADHFCGRSKAGQASE